MMNKILLLGTQDTFFSKFVELLTEKKASIGKANNTEQALAKTNEDHYDLIIIDQMVAEQTGIECLEQLIIINPMLNCAVVSPLSAEQFHEASEGLGVLMQLPVETNKQHIDKLFEHLQHINELSKRVENDNKRC